MPLYKSQIFFHLTVLSLSILAFRYSFFLFLNCLLTSRLTLVRLPTSLWFGSFHHWILACFVWSKNHKQSSSNRNICCLNSYRSRLSLGDVLIFSLMFSQVVFMSSLSLKLSKAASLFVISIWFCFLTSSSLSFLRLNLSTLNFCTACLRTANLSLTFATTR